MLKMENEMPRKRMHSLASVQNIYQFKPYSTSDEIPQMVIVYFLQLLKRILRLSVKRAEIFKAGTQSGRIQFNRKKFVNYLLVNSATNYETPILRAPLQSVH